MITALSIGRGGLGRFGNQMFTIAGCIGIAIKSGQPYGFPRWQTHDNAIFGQPVDDIEEYLVNELPRIPTGLPLQEYGYFWGYKDINLSTGSWSIDAHMQSYKFFEHCMPTIRNTFRFKDEPPQNDYVAIHFRAGDYIDDPTAQHPRCSKEYYEKAMALFPEGTRFKIFTDDRHSAIEKFGGYDNFMRGHYAYTSKGGIDISVPVDLSSYIEDFKLMKRCKSFIIANSSFSYMAALLGEHPDKKIIMPKIWFGSQMPPEFDTKDIYPPEAIVI